MFLAIPVKSQFVGEIKIGIIGPVGLPHWSPGMKEAAEMAAEEINAKGGVHLTDGNYKIVLAFGNEHAYPTPDASAAAAEVERLITVEGCEFIIGGFRSEVTGAMIEVAMDYKIPFWIDGASTSEFISETVAKNYDRYKYLFRIMPMNSTMLVKTVMASIAAYLLPKKLLPIYGTKLWPEAPNPQVKVAVLTEDLEWTRLIHYYLTTPTIYPTLLGPYANVTYAGRIPDGTTDCTPWLQAVKDSGARLLIHIFSGVTGVPLIMQWKAMQVGAMPVGINVLAQIQTHWTTTAGACEYESTLNVVGTRTPITPELVDFWDRFENRTGSWPIYTAFGSYMGIHGLVKNMEAIGTKDKDALVAYWESPESEIMQLNGKFRFDSIHDVYSTEFGPNWTQGYVRAFLCQWQAGRMEVVSPIDQSYSKRWAIPPWMYPLTSDINFDGKVDIRDIATVAKSFGTTPGHLRWEKEADINGDNKIDIRDVALVAKDFGKSISLPLP
jgi:branched-chain amino acid transport system substrate-binding protein